MKRIRLQLDYITSRKTFSPAKILKKLLVIDFDRITRLTIKKIPFNLDGIYVVSLNLFYKLVKYIINDI